MDSAAIYEPLDRGNREVRFLRMQHDGDGEIRCRLEVHSLDSEPEYLALSYCWTKELPTRRIFLEGQAFFVRPNLHEYLKVMSYEQECSLVFIDALCLNQEDDVEKIDQISLMGEIYSKARKVVAWMGIGGDRSSFVDGILPRLPTRSHAPSPKAIHERVEANEAIREAFARYEYWSRNWIVQEILLARHVELRFRRHRLSSDHLKHVMNGMEGLDNGGILHSQARVLHLRRRRILSRVVERLPEPIRHTQIAHRITNRSRWQGLLCVNIMRNLFSTAATGRSLRQRRGLGFMNIANAVVLTMTQQCSRSHDQIFAIIALTRSILVPNYSMPTIELYLRMLVEGILELQNLSTNQAKHSYYVQQEEFVGGLLFKMNFSPSDLTIVLVTTYVFGICGSGWNFWLSLLGDKYSSSSSPSVSKIYRRAVPLLFRWHRARNSRLAAPRDAGDEHIKTPTKSFKEWTSFVRVTANDVAEQMRDRRNMTIKPLDLTFEI